MLKAQILRILLGGPDKGMAVAFLRIEAGVTLGRKAGEAEMREALTDLKTKGLTTDGESSFTDDPVVKLTGAGRKAAAAL